MQGAINIELRDEGEDLDDWLNVEPTELDSSLRRYAKAGKATEPTTQTATVMEVDDDDDGEGEEDQLANEQAHRLKALADKMEGFVEGEGVMEGAMFEE